MVPVWKRTPIHIKRNWPHSQGSVSWCQVYIADNKREELLRIETLERVPWRKGTT